MGIVKRIRHVVIVVKRNILLSFVILGKMHEFNDICTIRMIWLLKGTLIPSMIVTYMNEPKKDWVPNIYICRYTQLKLLKYSK